MTIMLRLSSSAAVRRKNPAQFSSQVRYVPHGVWPLAQLARVPRVPSELWGRSGIGLGMVWGRSGVGLGSLWGRPGVGLGSA